MYSYNFDPIAAIEYEDAFNWYLVRSILPADNFMDAVELAISSICHNPFAYKNTYMAVRELPQKSILLT